MLSLLAACEGGVTDVPSPVPIIVAGVAQHAELVSIVADAARDFSTLPRIDNVLRAAPIPCSGFGMAAFVEVAPALSTATDGAHARKLFYLRTKDLDVYAGDAAVPTGFVIIKESFVPEVVPPPRPECNTREGPYCMEKVSTVTADGQRLRAGSPNGLFVMAKVAALAGTDEHWIYGTVSTAGVVTSAGRVANCMQCHQDGATHERLFGVQ